MNVTFDHQLTRLSDLLSNHLHQLPAQDTKGMLQRDKNGFRRLLDAEEDAEEMTTRADLSTIRTNSIAAPEEKPRRTTKASIFSRLERSLSSTRSSLSRSGRGQPVEIDGLTITRNLWGHWEPIPPEGYRYLRGRRFYDAVHGWFLAKDDDLTPPTEAKTFVTQEDVNKAVQKLRHEIAVSEEHVT